jgi:hypothetical protein
MAVSDPDGYALLWLSELGAVVPEHHSGDPPTDPDRYGMRCTPLERARRHSRALTREGRPPRA